MPSSQSSAPRPSPIALSPSSLMLSVTLFAAGERPCWSLVPRAKKFFLRMIPRGPQAQGAKIAPGQTHRWLRPARREGRRGLMASTYILPNRARITRPCWILVPRAKKFLRMIPRGPQAQCAKIEPGQTNLWLRAARGEARSYGLKLYSSQ
jgi:hypothetical protein